MIQLEYRADGFYIVYFNNKELGTFVQYEDGYFNFLPNTLPGYWSSHSLRLVADELEKLNKDWDDYITKNLGKNLEV
jgi:hypothetical protein